MGKIEIGAAIDALGRPENLFLQWQGPQKKLFGIESGRGEKVTDDVAVNQSRAFHRERGYETSSRSPPSAYRMLRF